MFESPCWKTAEAKLWMKAEMKFFYWKMAEINQGSNVHSLCQLFKSMVKNTPCKAFNFEAIINVDTDSDSYACHSQLCISKKLCQTSHFFLIQLGVSSIF